MKKIKKSLALLLVLTMVLTLFAGIAQASPGNVNIRGISVNVAPTSVVTPTRALGLVELTNAAQRVVAGGENLAVTLRLPSGFTFAAAPGVGVLTLNGVASTVYSFTGAPVRDDVYRNVAFTLAAPLADINNLRVPLGSVSIPTTHRGAINVEVTLRSFMMSGGQEIEMWVQTGTVQIGNVLTPGTVSAAVTKPVIQRGVAGQAAGNITITENVVGSITATVYANEITITAPAGVLFSSPPAVAVTGGMAAAVSIPAGETFPRSSFNINVITASSTTRSVITISGIRFNVEPQVADGDVGATIVGAAGANVTPATVANATVGAVAVGQVTVDADPATPAADRTVNVGRENVVIANIRLRETAAGAIQVGRVVSLTLPVGFTWHSAGAVTGVDPALVVPTATSNSDMTISYWTTGVASTALATRIISGLTINARANAPAGDIVVTVGGTAGVSGTVVVGRARLPYTVTALTAPNVRADQRNQALGNLVVTENFAGALRANQTLTVNLPAGVTMTSGVTPTVATAGGPGTMTAGTVTVEPVNRRSFTVATASSASTVPTTWTISGISVDLDRVPVGNLSVTLGGTAVIPIVTATVGGVVGTSGLADDADVLGTSVGSAVLANVVPATASRSVFTIGALSFVHDGVSRPMLVGPTIVGDRTLLPVRYAAQAVGVSGDNIIWDRIRRTVTLIHGDRIVQFQMGSPNMLINGMSVPLSEAPAVPPSIINGRVMLPIGALTFALRAGIVWDGTARTVTVTVN